MVAGGKHLLESTASASYGMVPYATGWYYSFGSNAQTTLAMTADELRAAVAWFPEGYTLTKLGLEVTVAGGASSVVRLGVYKTGSDGNPGDLLVDGGTIDASTTGTKEVTISQVIPTSGWYWVCAAAQADASTPTIRAVRRTDGPGPLAQALANALNVAQRSTLVKGSVSGAFPASFGSPNPTGTDVTPRVVWLGTKAA